jgi:Transposase DDE domain
VATSILRGHKLSGQNAVNSLFRELGEVTEVVTESAYRQARQKLKPELFIDLNEMVVSNYYRLYEADGGVGRWKGRRLCGVDGSYLNLPDTEELRAGFSLQKCQNGRGERVQALSSICYDLLNDVALSAGLGPKQAEKNFLFEAHLSALKPGDVVVLDRCYTDYAVMAFEVGQGCDFVIRFKRRGFKVVDEFWQSDEVDKVVELGVSRYQRVFVRERGLPERLKVRLVKVELEDGEIEMLGTSLLDAAKYPRAELKQVYGWRWGEEVWIGRIKNVFELERFSGKNKLVIEQDFYGMIFLASLESILSKSDESQLQRECEERGRKYAVQVNHAVSYLTLVDYAVALLLDTSRSVEEVLEELHVLFKTNPVPIRPGRKFPREKRSLSNQLWHYKYKRRSLS